MSVILYNNSHNKDCWSKERVTTWLLLEDNGTEDGGKILAEFRQREHAVVFCDAMKWVYFE